MTKMDQQNNSRILLVDDDPANLTVIQEALAREGYSVKAVENGALALTEVACWKPHLVLLDVNMPGMSGHELLKKINSGPEFISVIFVSGNSATEDIICGLDAGADDYVCKPFIIPELLARVRARLRIKSLQDQLAEANRKLTEMVEVDDLTGLYNMRSLYDKLDRELSRCRRFGRSVVVVMLDMDHFKKVNDQNDHLVGSQALAEVGRIISKNVRKIDHAARYGGDEFIIILSELKLNGAITFCERLRKAIEQHEFRIDGNLLNLTCSIGFAISAPESPTHDARELVRKADRALYDAKEASRNCLCYYDMSINGQTKAVKCEPSE